MSYHDKKYKLLWHEHAHSPLLILFHFKLSQTVNQVCVFVLCQCSSGGREQATTADLAIHLVTDLAKKRFGTVPNVALKSRTVNI